MAALGVSRMTRSASSAPELVWPGFPILSRLCSRLLLQVSTTGLFIETQCTRANHESFLNLAREKIDRVALVLDAMHELVGPPEYSNCFPIVSNTGSWSEPGLLGGYMKAGIRVKPSEFLASMLSCWHLGSADGGALANRLWRSAMNYALRERDYIKSLDFLLDLAMAGYAPFSYALSGAASRIINIYLRSAERFREGLDPERLEVQGRRPTGSLRDITEDAHRQLREIERRAELEELDRRRAVFLFQHLLQQHRFSEEKARKATSCEEFFRAQVRVKYTANLLRAFRHSAEPLLLGSPALDSVYDQLSEVAADEFAYSRTAFKRSLLYPSHRAVSLSWLWVVFASNFGKQWQEKLSGERLLLPDALREVASNAPEGDELLRWEPKLPDQWTRVSLDFALALSHCWERRVECLRRSPYSIERLKKHRGWQMLSEKLALSLPQEEYLLRKNYYQEGSTETPDEQVSDEVAESFGEELEAVLQGMFAETIQQQVLPLIERSQDCSCESQMEERLRGISTLLEEYPGFHSLALEAGICKDKLGRTEEALEAIEAAVFLSPGTSINWSSMAVVCRRLGEKGDARAASIIGKLVKKVELKRSK